VLPVALQKQFKAEVVTQGPQSIITGEKNVANESYLTCSEKKAAIYSQNVLGRLKI